MMNETIKLQKNTDLGFTAVPDSFIDTYMLTAPGEYVKLYLYLLRCVNSKEPTFTMAKTADAFGTSEADIKRGLLYWEKKGLFSLEFDDGNLSALHFGALSRPSEKQPSASKPSAGSDLRRTDVPNYSLSEIRAFLADNEFAQLQFIAESYIKRPLKQKDLCYILYWHQSLGFSADLIIYLIEICVSEKKSSFSMIHRTALTWYQNGVKNQADVRLLAQTEETAKTDSHLVAQVKKAMALNRSLNDKEESFLTTWSEEWHFSPELICEACRRSISNIHEPSFEYANKILLSWHEAGVCNMKDVTCQDQLFKEKQEAYFKESRAKTQKKANKTQKFQNFTGRSGNNYEELERALIGSM